jgi:hypothetical protein
MNEIELNEKLRASRKAKFTVKIHPAWYPEEPGEIQLSWTHNGYQFQSANFTRAEVEKVVAALQASLEGKQ